MIRLRISLKWFLLGTASIGVLVGTIGKRTYDDWQRRQFLAHQQRICDELRNLGCAAVMRDGCVVEVYVYTIHGAQAMTWIKDATKLEKLSSEYPLTDDEVAQLSGCRELHTLGPLGPGSTDHALRTIERLTKLKLLGISDARITDAGLVHLARLEGLRNLSLRRTAVRGPGLAHLRALPNLETLYLQGSPIDDQGLSGLADCKSLRELHLDRTNVSGVGLAHLRSLPDLMKLNLSETTLIAGEGLAELDQVKELDLTQAKLAPGVIKSLGGMDGLRRLDLVQVRLSAEMLAEFKHVQLIRWLDLCTTKITDGDLVHFRDRQWLVRINLRGTAVTEEGAKELSRYCPSADIWFGKSDSIAGDPHAQFKALQPAD